MPDDIKSKAKLHQSIKAAFNADLCIVPPAQDGSKRPKPGSSYVWEPYKTRLATKEELNLWYGTGHQLTGVGIVCGAVSNNLEAFDADDPEIWEAFLQRAEEWGHGGLIAKLEAGYFEKTPGGAGHYLYRCDIISGNVKLATRPKKPEEMKHKKDKVKVRFETRGEGGYIVTAPTYGSVHETGQPYILVSGGFASIPTISPEERQSLFNLARSFHVPTKEEVKREVKSNAAIIKGSGRPGDDFNARATWNDVLEPHEWTPEKNKDGTEHWRKPGGSLGATHATTNYGDSDLLYVFSTETSFEPEKAYSKFSAYAHLNHGDDFKAAAKDLASQGYGISAKASVTEKDDQPGEVDLVCAADVKTQPINWLWVWWLAAGKLIILAGAPGTGKSTCAYSLAATISTGGTWPDGTKMSEPGDVMVWSGEDAADDTIVPRLQAAGADLTRVHIIKSVNTGEGKRPFDPSTDIAALAPAVKAIHPKILIVDSIVSAVSGDSHKNTETRRGLQPLVDLGEKFGVAVLGISHFTKGTQGKDPLERVTGSLAFGALARLVWAAAKLPENHPSGHERAFLRIKSNIGPDGNGFGYSLKTTRVNEIETVKVTWDGNINGNAREILAESSESGARAEAKQFLRQFLKDGPQLAIRVKESANAAGIAAKTLDRAKTDLRIVVGKDGFDGGWSWSLPT